MIHDKNSAHARKNIRVDVEVTDEWTVKTQNHSLLLIGKLRASL
jgi:hypothetical protein